jgi:hypothetical protein
MSISRNGFQTFVNNQPPPAVCGDFASMNPRATVVAGPGGLLADTATPVVVGNFAWALNGVAYGVKTALAAIGFVANELQTVITDYLGQSRLVVQGGFPVSLYSYGDFWAFVQGGAVAVGATIYADRDTGAPTVFNGAFAGTANQTGSSTTMTVTAATAGKLEIGDVLIGSGVDSGLTIVAQLTGTPGGVGTYTVSTNTGFSSTAITTAAENVDTGYKAATALAADTTATGCSLAAGTGILTVGSVTGSVQIGANVSGTGVPANLFIKAQLTGTAGQAGTYQTNTIGPAVSSFTGTFTVGKLVKISKPA